MAIVKEFFASLKRVGLWNTGLIIVGRIYVLWFDRRYGLDTAKRAELGELSIDSDQVKKGQKYQPTSALALKRLLRSLTISPNDVFVDYGSGKGRTLVVAAQAGFQQLVGIEFAAALSSVAEENVERYQRLSGNRSEFRLVNDDATRYEYRDDETVFYFFFPFDAEIMSRVLDGIEQSLERSPRRALLIYYLPIHRSVVDDSRLFRLQREENLFGYPCLIFSNDQP